MKKLLLVGLFVVSFFMVSFSSVAQELPYGGWQSQLLDSGRTVVVHWPHAATRMAVFLDGDAIADITVDVVTSGKTNYYSLAQPSERLVLQNRPGWIERAKKARAELVNLGTIGKFRVYTHAYQHRLVAVIKVMVDGELEDRFYVFESGPDRLVVPIQQWVGSSPEINGLYIIGQDTFSRVYFLVDLKGEKYTPDELAVTKMKAMSPIYRRPEGSVVVPLAPTGRSRIPAPLGQNPNAASATAVREY